MSAYNGSSKKDNFVVSLSKYFDFIPFCHEDAILSHPIESMRLVLDKDGKIHAIGNKTKNNYTESILNYYANAAKTAKNNFADLYLLQNLQAVVCSKPNYI
ncbi:hypothetical protein DESAMIL20_388 [Desulfurella amilsii]|uniref:Uncharacterized protein n=1 Tax=Desulfurella amilsii TaxID=1562698 RepID=A0A1X4XZ14_9BACT|nr:DUF523 domain-containing protein [Desulfurella amilsii]OSS42782.1 hypothetical protein DESAMIL20_388 [Desulfurella amilsii]